MRLTLILIGLLFLTVGSVASTVEHVRAINGAMDHSNPPSVSIEQRRELASKFKAYWIYFSDRLPRLSPDEERWVLGEINGGAERFFAVRTRREYAIKYLLDRAKLCADIYGRLESATVDHVRYEGYLWARSQACYRKWDEVIGFLEQANLSRKADGAFFVAWFGIWEEYTIDKIVGWVLNPP